MQEADPMHTSENTTARDATMLWELGELLDLDKPDPMVDNSEWFGPSSQVGHQNESSDSRHPTRTLLK